MKHACDCRLGENSAFSSATNIGIGEIGALNGPDSISQKSLPCCVPSNCPKSLCSCGGSALAPAESPQPSLALRGIQERHHSARSLWTNPLLAQNPSSSLHPTRSMLRFMSPEKQTVLTVVKNFPSILSFH